MMKDTTAQTTRSVSLDRSIERLRQQLRELVPFLSNWRDKDESVLDEFDMLSGKLIRDALGETSEMAETYEYAQFGEAAGLVNFPDEAPEGGAGTRDLARESLNQRKRVLESCVAELEARRAVVGKKKELTYAVIGPQVTDHMSLEIRTVRVNASLKEAAQLMQQWRVGSLLVIDDRSYVGVITDTDLARDVVARGLDASTEIVKTCMRTPPITIEVDQPIIEAVRLMKDKGTRHLAVTDQDQIIGVISVSNILRYYSGVV
ncbi:MAG: CBS domain-containing protein [Nitrospirota bacterium]|nr:CBS domain-containing protein [Nitrospirota bacterium]